jgi:hypothetical protein
METPVVEAFPAAPLSREPFSAGGVLSQAFSVWSSNLPLFAGSTALLLLPTLLLPAVNPAAPSTMVWSGVYILYASLVSLVVSGAFIFGVVQQLRGQKVSPGELIKAGTQNAIPLLATGLVTGLMVVGGYLLLLVPGILLSLRWMLVSPVVVMEPDANPRKRSSALTEGHRGSLFGLIILVTIVGGILGGVVGAILGNQSLLARFIERVVDTSLTSSFQAVLYGSAYYALRVEKEGVDIEQLASVFD